MNTIHICEGCVDPDAERRVAKMGGGPELLELMRENLADDASITIKAHACVGNCSRRLRLSISAPGRWGYLFGEITRDDVADLVAMIATWRAAPDGKVERAARPEALRAKILGWTPPD
jgi:predicted metal-binding protein